VSREFSLSEFAARDPLSFSHVVPGGFFSAKGDKRGLNVRVVDERIGDPDTPRRCPAIKQEEGVSTDHAPAGIVMRASSSIDLSRRSIDRAALL
jgi:hypothetical protein